VRPDRRTNIDLSRTFGTSDQVRYLAAVENARTSRLRRETNQDALRRVAHCNRHVRRQKIREKNGITSNLDFWEQGNTRSLRDRRGRCRDEGESC